MPFDFIDDVTLDHASLDAKVCDALNAIMSNSANPPPPTDILQVVKAFSPEGMFISIDVLSSISIITDHSRDPDGDENSNLTKLLVSCWRRGEFRKIRCLKILRPTRPQFNWKDRESFHITRKLDAAYTTPFVGSAAVDFISFLHRIDNDIRRDKFPAYAKAISVLQSSGAGKSRMLTEAGKHIFTLPICLRHPHSPGYPRSDKDVHDYFAKITNNNDLSYTAHSAIARFLAAAHKTMLSWLKKKQQQDNLYREELHKWWYGIMEQRDGQEKRQQFFTEVLAEVANITSGPHPPGDSPKRPSNKRDAIDCDIVEISKEYYQCARDAVEDLHEFLANLDESKKEKPLPLWVTYFDEAHELQNRFWILLRLLGHQPKTVKMWYVFLGTKSSVTYFTPAAADLVSLRLGNELRKLLPPYIALGFDHNVSKEVTATIGQFQSLEHIASYGRPMWKALLPDDSPGDLVRAASLKLTNAAGFDPRNKDHVFAVLSQRVCIEPVLVGSEAIGLADRSVAHHMRLITGISDDRRIFYTYSPSEPILVLGAVNNLYDVGDAKCCLGQVLDTLSNHLCSAGLVEKGLTGELAARILLILARDFAAPKDNRGVPNLLKPVPLLTVINELFGNKLWGTAEDRQKYSRAFGTAHVNFTHWVVTKDPLPETPDRDLLANLWARGAILQCCFTQQSIDFLMVMYHGDINTEASFDPAMLSAVFGQVKNKSKADTAAEQAIRPIGLPRDRSEPLPYLALLFELGNESYHGAVNSKIKVTTPTSTTEFQELTDHRLAAEQDLARGEVHGDPKLKLAEMKENVKNKKRAMDNHKRYTIAVRGASSKVYGILVKAQVETEFATLLTTTMPSPTAQDESIKRMRPLERLNGSHTAWMSKYVVGNSMVVGDSMDVDV